MTNSSLQRESAKGGREERNGGEVRGGKQGQISHQQLVGPELTSVPLTRRSKPGNYLNNETKKLSNQLNNSATCYCVTRAREWLFCDVISAVLVDALFIVVERGGRWGAGTGMQQFGVSVCSGDKSALTDKGADGHHGEEPKATDSERKGRRLDTIDSPSSHKLTPMLCR